MNLFDATFMPHGHCYFWRPEILYLHVASDVLIMLAYYSIPATLVYFVRKRRDLPFNWIFLLFGAFIFLCGTTHAIDVWTTWSAEYGIEGIVKAVTAVVSVVTAVLLVPLAPKALALPGLQTSNDQLRAKAQELQVANDELETFNRSLVSREERMIELKREVNTLADALGRPAPYAVEVPDA